MVAKCEIVPKLKVFLGEWRVIFNITGEKADSELLLQQLNGSQWEIVTGFTSYMMIWEMSSLYPCHVEKTHSE